MTKQVEIGIIGCGRISESHASGYLAIPEKAKIVATCDVVVQLAKEKAKNGEHNPTVQIIGNFCKEKTLTPSIFLSLMIYIEK